MRKYKIQQNMNGKFRAVAMGYLDWPDGYPLGNNGVHKGQLCDTREQAQALIDKEKAEEEKKKAEETWRDVK